MIATLSPALYPIIEHFPINFYKVGFLRIFIAYFYSIFRKISEISVFKQ